MNVYVLTFMQNDMESLVDIYADLDSARAVMTEKRECKSQYLEDTYFYYDSIDSGDDDYCWCIEPKELKGKLP